LETGPLNLDNLLLGDITKGFPRFCLERWQSMHETRARILLSESGLEPLSIAQLEELGVPIGDLRKITLGYGWTRGSPEARRSILSLYDADLDIDNIVVTNGSAEANFAGILSLLRERDTVVVDLPTYMQVPGLLRWVRANVIELKRSPPKWNFPLDKAIHLIEEKKPKLFFITDPNNPTGKYMRARELEELIVTAERRNVRLFFDEVYWGSEQEDKRPSAIEVGDTKNVTVVHGLSKVYGLPGLRIGWIITDPAHAEKAWSVKDYTSIAPSVISDYITSKLLSNHETVNLLRERARRIVKENMSTLKEKIEVLAGKINPHWPEAGAFLLIETRGIDSLNLSKQLYYNHGILVNPGECFELTGYLRIGLGTDPSKFKEEAGELVQALQQIL
jgi:aspartate/methionine/tyrosine aminotransferase